MPELITPTTRLYESWTESRDEWGHDEHPPGAGLRATDEVGTAAGFAAWVARLRAAEVSVPDGWVRCSFRWIVEGDRYLGAIALRHELNDFLLDAGGHIGYGIRPSERKRGLATWALAEVLPLARELGLDRVLITCDDDNPASARVIERHGGVLEDVRDTTLGIVRRYWITL
ncbi:GNAT family N-acetyltransferase [Actinoplanes derwentensis]|uniref:Predicted acetyltransferase n=1 Tax=Actinoplanes derwentensis TaxID=113562 RepID=A0A1H1QFR0_9ACTN|nr:GNAT family N-acetyltransferase [Actinoplanes derwentensis]GID82147.1 acetyltransferase [Actinoplanes derwentensis]SDS22338.1 Predicted acetyltransferase [Actinoplanes derwentensis]